MLCPKGQVSFYADGLQGPSANGDRIPQDELSCIACADLDAELGLVGPDRTWAHTYAPRAGMSECTPCPGGTVPVTDSGGTSSCAPCPNGRYRDPYSIR